MMAGKDRPQQLDEGTTVGQCHRGLCNVDFSLCIAAPAAEEFSSDFAPENALNAASRKVSGTLEPESYGFCPGALLPVMPLQLCAG